MTNSRKSTDHKNSHPSTELGQRRKSNFNIIVSACKFVVYNGVKFPQQTRCASKAAAVRQLHWGAVTTHGPSSNRKPAPRLQPTPSQAHSCKSYSIEYQILPGPTVTKLTISYNSILQSFPINETVSFGLSTATQVPQGGQKPGWIGPIGISAGTLLLRYQQTAWQR